MQKKSIRLRRLLIVFVLACYVGVACSKPSEKNDNMESLNNLSPSELEKRATSGEVLAQNNLGLMYANGDGVPKDLAKAFEWWQKAASQGDASAQFNLGLMYYNGNGVPKDRILAYAWFNLAAANSDNPQNSKIRDVLEKGLTTAELAEAQSLSSNWKMGEVLTRKGE